MQEIINIAKHDLEQLQECARTLALEKSHLQLVNNLMNKLSAESEVEKTVQRIVNLVLESLGGNNVSLFYVIDGAIHYADAYGQHGVLRQISDEMVRTAFEKRQVVEQERSFVNSGARTPEFTKASYWAFPLVVGDSVVGVLKAEGMLMPAADGRSVLQPFLNYAALVLKNSIDSQSKLRETYEKLQSANHSLQEEMDERYRQQQFLQAVLDSVDAGIMVCDANGIVTMFNRKTRELHELSVEPVPAEQWAEHYGWYGSDGKTLLSKEETPLFRALKGEHVTNAEVLVRSVTGDTRVVLTSGHLIRDKEGQTFGAVLALHDVTELKALEMQLRHGQKLEAVGQLAAGIAHEINTPAQFVGDNVRFLRDAFQGLDDVLCAYRRALDKLTAAPEFEALAQEISRQEESSDLSYLEGNVPFACDAALDGVSRISSIVGAMKEFAHPDRREKTSANLNQALKSTLVIARNEYKYVADVETQFSDLPPVMCHPGDLNQVFLNLLINAAHAIEDVVKDSGNRGKIRVRTASEGDFVRIEISDTGCGISDENRHRVFEPFFTTKEVGKGSGQGLAIARSIIVDKHHGSLTFESAIGKGTTFTMLLPVNGEPHPERAARAAAGNPGQSGDGGSLASGQESE